jgi:lambda repressor-like predicted transcriptional regulator
MANNTTKKASQLDWHPADILAALHKRGITLRALAAQHGFTSSSTLSAAMVRSYPANEKRIAEALDIHPKSIWPSRYNEDGTRKPQGLRAMKSTQSHCQRNGNNCCVA